MTGNIKVSQVAWRKLELYGLRFVGVKRYLSGCLNNRVFRIGVRILLVC